VAIKLYHPYRPTQFPRNVRLSHLPIATFSANRDFFFDYYAFIHNQPTLSLLFLVVTSYLVLEVFAQQLLLAGIVLSLMSVLAKLSHWLECKGTGDNEKTS